MIQKYITRNLLACIVLHIFDHDYYRPPLLILMTLEKS